VGGIDAAHKLALLAAIAFGAQVDFGAVQIEGIERITIEDIRHAADMGFRIKLLGVAQRTGRGLECRMTPCLVPAASPLGQLDRATNMVVLEGDAAGQIVLRGAGAGEGPTASAVLSDILDIARGTRVSTFGQPAATLAKLSGARVTSPAPFYLRMALVDKPGALAKIATVLGDAGVSIDRMRQYGHADAAAPVLIVTHRTSRHALDARSRGWPRPASSPPTPSRSASKRSDTPGRDRPPRAAPLSTSSLDKYPRGSARGQTAPSLLPLSPPGSRTSPPSRTPRERYRPCPPPPRRA
jgi:homoserine dehydrogenase